MTANRRTFIQTGVTALGALSAFPALAQDETVVKKPYNGPNVIIIRFGGGVRRRETIDADHTYSPFFCHELTKRGTLFKNMEIAQLSEDKEEIETSHGQGTLYILTGKYEHFQDIAKENENIDFKLFGSRFEAKVPTIFEYMRKVYDVPEHQTVIINGEDRTDEEFYNFSNHHLFGASFRSNTLSLHRFKTYLLRQQVKEFDGSEKDFKKLKDELTKMESIDYRVMAGKAVDPNIEAFWQNWRGFYGDSGFVNPRGDRLLTELALRAVKQLRPKMMMINYNDPDYVHWGNPAHYTLGISVIDRGMEQIMSTVEADEEYRDNTVYVIVPDCGRDANRMMDVPFQHHFNSRSSREIFALVIGPGIQKGAVVDGLTDQSSIASTIGAIINTPTEFTEGPVLEEVFA
jgi:hypothetical protein